MQGTTARLQHPATIAAPPLRVDAIGYIACEYELKEVAHRLKRHGYRGAIVGPTGCGKSIMLQALGDELMEHGLSPLPLHVEPDRSQALPTNWRRTIRKARHTDALLLDGYDLLPWWARAWVCLASIRAGAVVVTGQRAVRFKTLARPKPTAALLQELSERLHHRPSNAIDYNAVLKQCNSNLRAALQHICQQINADRSAHRPAKKHAG